MIDIQQHMLLYFYRNLFKGYPVMWSMRDLEHEIKRPSQNTQTINYQTITQKTYLL